MTLANRSALLSSSGSVLGRIGTACLLLTALGLTARPVAGQQGEVCAKVQVQFSSKIVLTRTVFEARFGLENATSSLLEGVTVTFSITDSQGSDALDPTVFTIGDPQTQGFFGTSLSMFPAYELGNVAPSSVADATWTFVPLDEATPLGENETYTVSGTLTYVKNGTLVVLPLFPEDIEIVPNADLSLRFFLQRRVYSDNPLTQSVLEPAEPFSLGLLVENEGQGTASDVVVQTQMPTILDNQFGLPISFDIEAVQNGFEPLLAASQVVDLGDVEPGGVRVVRWKVTSSLEGDFSAPEAAFEYMTDLGVPEVPLIDVEQDVSGLVHMVDLSVDPSLDDGLPDFLIADEMPPGDDPQTMKPYEDVPDFVESSSGEQVPVTSFVNEQISGSPGFSNSVATMDVQFPSAGWYYIRAADPGQDDFDLVQVSRSGSSGPRTQLNVGGPGDISNVWTTERVFDTAADPDSVPDGVQYLAHVLDWIPSPGTYTYELVYMQAPDAALQSNLDLASVSSGSQQTQALSLDAGPQFRGLRYLVLGTTSGTTPGVLVDGISIPINSDAFTQLLLGLALQGGDLVGKLDSQGQGQATVVVPAGLDTALAGTELHFAFAVFSKQDTVVYASNAASLLLVP